MRGKYKGYALTIILLIGLRVTLTPFSLEWKALIWIGLSHFALRPLFRNTSKQKQIISPRTAVTLRTFLPCFQLIAQVSFRFCLSHLLFYYQEILTQISFTLTDHFLWSFSRGSITFHCKQLFTSVWKARINITKIAYELCFKLLPCQSE